MVKKLYPVNRLDIAHMEHWLEDMADEGLFLTSLGTFFVTFASDVPQKVKYRFIPLAASDKRMEPTPEERKLFLSTGWEFIDHLDEQFLVYQSKEDYPQEIPMEDGVQQERFQSLAKRFRRDYTLCALLTVVAFGVVAFVLPHNFHEFILFEEAILDHFSLLLFLLTIPFGRSINRKTLQRIKSYGEDMKNLAFDREEDMVVTASRIFVSAMHAFAGILVPILGIVVILGMYATSNDDWISIEQTSDAVPQINLEELTGETVMSQDSAYKKEYTIFAPTQYTMNQTAFTKPSMDDIRLYWHYYEVTSSELAEIAFDTWMASDGGTPFGFDIDEDEKISIDTDLMDKAYIHSVNDGWTSFWFLQDNVIVAGEYIGGEKDAITENLDLFADVMG